MIGGVAEEGERRRHAISQHPTQQRIRIRWTFDEHGIGLVLGERSDQRAGRTRSMVANAEHLDRRSLLGSVLTGGTDDMIINGSRRQRRRHDTSRQAV
jgi:hypothetical protein